MKEQVNGLARIGHFQTLRSNMLVGLVPQMPIHRQSFTEIMLFFTKCVRQNSTGIVYTRFKRE